MRNDRPEPFVKHAHLFVSRPIDEVFAFFADAANLQVLTPPWLNFAILTPPPIRMRRDALIDYRLRVRGVPIRWRTRIAEWDPPHRFVDEQLRGPYRMWVHEHEFIEHEGGTLCRDRVVYRVPGGPLAPLVHRWFVKPDVDRIFEYRMQKLRQTFGETPRSGPARPSFADGRMNLGKACTPGA